MPVADADPRPEPTDPTPVPSGGQWILKAFEDLNARLDRMEKRQKGTRGRQRKINEQLGGIERKIAWTIGAATGIGAFVALLVALISLMLALDFSVSIDPPAETPP